MPRPEPWLIALIAAASAMLAVVVAFQAVVAFREWRDRKDALASINQGESEGRPMSRASVMRKTAENESEFIRALGNRVPQVWDLHHALTQSGLSWSLQGFAFRVLLFALIGAVVAWIASGRPWAAPIGAALGGWLPVMYLKWRRKRRLIQLESQLPDAIDLMSRAVRAGHPLSEGLRMAGEEAQEPLAAEFRVTFEEQKFGLPFEEALMSLGDRVEIVDMRILITAILVQREVGGNLSEILEQISETMRARFTLKRQVRVYTSQGRMSGYTLAALPILVGLAISLINPDYMRTLFVEPIGQAMLGGALVMQFIGFLWIRRIVDVRY